MSNLIPREFIQQLLDRIEIVDLIDGRVPLKKKSGNNYFACCPFHTEKSASFSVSQAKQFFYCFGCGASGNAIDFLLKYDRLSFPEAVEALAKQIGMEVPRSGFHSPEKTIKQTSLHDLLEKISQFYQSQLRNHSNAIEYLKKRGLTGDIAKQFEVGFAPPGWESVYKQFENQKSQLFDAGMLIKKDDGGCYDRFRERIMFPIRDRRGKVIGFGGRIIDKGEPKYLNSPETPIFQKGHELYGLFQALKAHRELKKVLIVEGYMDVISLFQHGITYAVATLGTATTANHLQRLFRYTPEIIFCFDGDNAGRTAASRALHVVMPVMKDGVQIRFMFLPENEDPDTLIRKEGKENFEARMQKSLTISEFFFQTIAHETDITSTDGRARFVKLAKEQIDKIPEGIFQQMMLDELANRSRMDISLLTKPQQKVQTTQIKKARSPSAMRLALTLLVQQPDLATLITEPLPAVDIKGYDFLLTLLDFLHQHPGLNTATLIEFWRDTPEEKILLQLAQFDHMVPEKTEQEFLGAIERLKEFGRKQTIEQMLLKASQSGLSDEEKKQLNELIQMG
jgi:DNA primase